MARSSAEQNNAVINRVLTGVAEKKAPHLEEIERKRALLAKVKTIRDAVLFNRGKIEGEEGKEYCWVNINNERQLTFQNLGWKRCDDSSAVTTSYKQPDGTHVRGDLILYEIDKEMAEALHLYNVLRGFELTEAAKEGFKGFAEQQGVPTFTPAI